MLKIVERTEDQCGCHSQGVRFILETDYLRIRPEDGNGGTETGLLVFDHEKPLFSLGGKLHACPAYFGWRVYFHDESLKKEYLAVAPKSPNPYEEYEDPICVDPRVIMACEALIVMYVGKCSREMIEEALNPLPSYEDAEKWLFDNHFAMGDPKGVWRRTDRCSLYEPRERVTEIHCVNLPPRVEEALRVARQRFREEKRRERARERE